MKFPIFNFKLSKIKLALISIVLIAAVLRLWQLGSVPPSPDWDEVALGYDAYSIIYTGKDEFGKLLPVVLRSFDDYKPALYAYLTVPSVLIFGLNTFAVRFPSVVFGIISTIAVYFLVKELFKNSNSKFLLALLSSLFFAISPWSIQFSRVGFEANIGVGLNILTVLFFLKGLRKPLFLILSSAFAGLSIYAYQSEKAFMPLLALALLFIYKKELFAVAKKYLIFTVLVGVIIVLPMAHYIISNKAALLRVTGTSIFSYQTELLKTDIQRIELDIKNNDKIGLIFDNRRVVYAKTILSGYLSHYDPNWLFIKGDIQRHHAPNMGLLYLFELPLILIGIYWLLFNSFFDKKTKFIIFSWLLIAPIPASITTEVPHAVRTLNFLPTWQIFSALGFLAFFEFIIKSKHKVLNIKASYFIVPTCILLIVFNFVFYLNQYFVQLNYYDSRDWQFGYKQVVDEVKTLEHKYNKIVISDDQPMDKSYMFFLFYLKYSPQDYQKIGENSAGGYAAHHSFGKYVFRPIDWSKDSKTGKTLFVGNTKEIPNGAPIIKTIYNLDGSVAMVIAGT